MGFDCWFGPVKTHDKTSSQDVEEKHMEYIYIYIYCICIKDRDTMIYSYITVHNCGLHCSTEQ